MNRFRGCVRDTRAEIPKAFSDELMALEVYVTWRGTGPVGRDAGRPAIAGGIRPLLARRTLWPRALGGRGEVGY